MEIDVAAIARMPTVNPLHQMAVVAAMNVVLAKQEGFTCDDGVAMPWLERIGEPSDQNEWPPIRRLQMEAVQACVAAHPEPDWETIYIDELSWAHSGFDLVIRNRQSEMLKLIEVKGTGVPFRSASSYLKHTQHKGRQMSWKWIWVSAMDLAAMPSTAVVFFPVVKALLSGALSRELRIVRFDAEPDFRRPLDMLVFDEGRLSRIDELNDFGWLSSKKQWLEEIEASPGFGFGFPECLGANSGSSA